MIFFIDFLRAVAMALITNSHYVGVYPTDILASGGLLGDVLFFAVSGFCLSNIRLPFHKWYVKRIFRIYPIVWIITIFYWIIGEYFITTPYSAFTAFVFPTVYHFVGSIIVMYILYYIFVMIDKKISGKTDKKSKFTIIVFLVTVVIATIVYILIYDKTYYHIDNVREPMIWFLYFEAMLVGYYIKNNLSNFENKKGLLKWIITAILFVVYFVFKYLLTSVASISIFQIVSHYILVALAVGIFFCVASLSSFLDKLPKTIKSVVVYLAKITLEIYVVQSVIIEQFKHISFPLNWIVITLVIIIAASILHYVIELPKLIYKNKKGSINKKH